MKLVKSLLLASAAGLVGVASAQAADLPSKKSAPAEYVKICDAHGAGFFYIPGSDTCLQISGYLRAQYSWVNTGKKLTYLYGTGSTASSKSQDATGFQARGRINFDARTSTSYGTLRSYVRFQIGHASGASPTWSQGTSPALDKGYIQWAGITAGRAQSMFDFYADNYGYDDLRGPDATVDMLAYTATFGGGFSGTIAIESGNKDRRQDTNVALGGYSSVTGLYSNGTFGSTGSANYWTHAGTRLPDVVGNLRVDQAWGSAQLSGVYHNQNTVAGSGIGAPSKTSSGWAINGGVQVKLPMIAPGDELWLQATYAKGALGYQTQGYARSFNGTKGWIVPDYDAVAIRSVDALGNVNYSIKTPSSWSVVASFQHYWAPTFSTNVRAGYMSVSYPNAVKRTGITGNWNEFRAGLVNEWTPVKGLTFGLDLIYTRLNQKAPALNNVAYVSTTVPFKKNTDSFQGILRVIRSF